MKRRLFLAVSATLGLVITIPILSNPSEKKNMTKLQLQLNQNPDTIEPFSLDDTEWRMRLSPDTYKVLRKEGTEPSFSSSLNDEKRKGQFACAGCGLALFNSEYKYNSGTGWPSFWNVIEGRIKTKRDFKLLLPRTEYHCARCGGHQGHIFKDGPEPTGLRYCNNGVALQFFAEGA